MTYKLFALLLLFTLGMTETQAQKGQESDIIEITGFVLVDKGTNNTREYIPFATVAVENSARGTYANYKGMYSIVVKKGETLIFSAVGFESFSITVPQETEGYHKSLLVTLEPKIEEVEEILVFPWPDRDNLRAEFLAMDPTRAMELEDVAKENLEQSRLMAIAASSSMDSRENATHYLRAQARDFSYDGQVKPIGITDPIAWSRFFKSFKKKKTKEEEEQEEKDNYKF
ncbi:MAG: carboxypeptidase-like regulatory domain-containing protein [Saprospiraceae bacterium]|nr:carboxypeptidase-like regulatory domain-containing protein [Saprospiraceae bacterium]